MTIRLASDGPQILHADTIGAAWLAVARRILADGIASRHDGRPVREISLVTLAVDRPDPADEIIARARQVGARIRDRTAYLLAILDGTS